MSEFRPIVARSAFDLETLMRSLDWHLARPRWVRGLKFVLIIGFTLIALESLYTRGLDRVPPWIMLAVAALYPFWLQLPRWFFRRQMEQHPRLGDVCFWRFTEEGFAQMTTGGKVDHPWEDCVGCTLTPEGYLIYTERQVYYWVPFEAFDSPEDVERLGRLLRDKLVCKRKL